jgi:uncharacterized protein (DUF952 family)
MSTNDDDDDDTFVPYQILDRPIYHFCVKSEWENAQQAQQAYFPPSFVPDGRMTHASMDNTNLLGAANFFYKSSKESWLCLELNPNVLLELGIHTMVEAPAPVGDQAAPEKATIIIRYPHIYGGISTTVPKLVTNVFPMTRDMSDGTFLSIPGLKEEASSDS